MPKTAASRPSPNALHPTHNDLPAKSRAALVALLSDRLLDALDLAMQCKQAHWTIKGPTFAALHELFDDVHEEVRGFVDDIAERAAALGGHVIGTVQAASHGSSLPKFPTELTDGVRLADALAASMGAFGKHTRAGIERAESLQDAVTADLFTSITRALDKKMWMLEAHSQR